MLVSIYIAIQVILVIAFAGAFITRNPALWAITALIAGTLTMNAWGLETVLEVPNNMTTIGTAAGFFSPATNSSSDNTTSITTYSTTMTTVMKSDTSLFAINLGIFLYSIVYLFFCIYTEIQTQRN